MDKPKDYNEYFNTDGTPKSNPYRNADGTGKPGVSAKGVAWSHRQFEIRYSLMSDKEKAEYHARTDNMRRKMAF